MTHFTRKAKWTISLLATTFLLAGWLSPTVFASQMKTFRSEDYNYVILKDGSAEIIKYSGNARSLIVPDSLGGYPVRSIGYRGFDNCDSLKSVTLLNGLKFIGNNAFSTCDNLTSIVFSKELQSIGDIAFYACKNLTSPILPEGLQSIGGQSFFRCESFTDLTIPDSLREIVYNPFTFTSVRLNLSPDHAHFALIDGVLFDKAEKRLIAYPYGSTKKEYSVPKGIHVIGEFAFYKCDDLITVSLPEGVKSINGDAFSDCRNLSNIDLPPNPCTSPRVS